MQDARSARYFFHRQAWQLLAVAVLLPLAVELAGPSLGEGSFAGFTTRQWFHGTLWIAVIHQIYVWVFWRLQLGWQLITKALGRAGFWVFGIVFLVMLIARPILAVGLAISDAGSLPVPAWLGWSLGGLLCLPAPWVGWSIHRYFGIARALGADHFFEDYRRMPKVDQGAFRVTRNAMYGLFFLSFWGMALIARSQAGLAAALFVHAMIWVHYWCTEKPDLDQMYRSVREPGPPID